MKLILQDRDNFIIRFDKGEEVIAGLADFMKQQQISGCVFSGLGAVSEIEIAFYNPFVKGYRNKPFVEELEVICFSGNGSLKDNEPVAHAHGCFGRNDFSTIAGHVLKLVVSATCEIHLVKINGNMKRENNPELNLNLLV